MTHLELNPTGNRHVDEKLEPYVKLQFILAMLVDKLYVFEEEFKMELKNDVDLRTPYQDILGGLEDAKGNLPNLEKLAEQIAESLMEEKQFTQRDIG